MPVLSTRIVLDCFYLLIFYCEKFSTDVCRLPYAVNVNLNLSNSQSWGISDRCVKISVKNLTFENTRKGNMKTPKIFSVPRKLGCPRKNIQDCQTQNEAIWYARNDIYHFIADHRSDDGPTSDREL